MVCNADEGDPGAFIDRNILEDDLFTAIEGITIGVTQGYVHVRAEYPLAIEDWKKHWKVRENLVP